MGGFLPPLGRQHKMVRFSLISKLVEFDQFEVGVIQLLPTPTKLDGARLRIQQLWRIRRNSNPSNSMGLVRAEDADPH